MTRTLAVALVLVLVVLGASCGTTPANTADATTPDLTSPPPRDFAAVPDLAAPADLSAVTDLSAARDLLAPPDSPTVPDLRGPAGDLAFPKCNADNECRLYSSMCANNPCQCIPLPVGAPDPVCLGPMVKCFMDPCAGKKAVCDRPVGMCLAQ